MDSLRPRDLRKLPGDPLDEEAGPGVTLCVCCSLHLWHACARSLLNCSIGGFRLETQDAVGMVERVV